jgi:prepilin-type N-terminal cleavage/methylation domain-containing protein
MTDSTWSRCGKSITRPARRAGFSLVEILVVLAILGIAATISGIALFSYMPRSDLKYAARNITSLCQLARIEAIKRNIRVAVVFTAGTQTCSLYIANGDGDWLTEGDNTLLRRFDMSGVGRGVGFGHGGATVNVAGNAFGSNLPLDQRFEFDGRGARRSSTSTEENNTVYVQNIADGSMAITVHPSGGVMVRDWGGGVWR